MASLSLTGSSAPKLSSDGPYHPPPTPVTFLTIPPQRPGDGGAVLQRRGGGGRPGQGRGLVAQRALPPAGSRRRVQDAGSRRSCGHRLPPAEGNHLPALVLPESVRLVFLRNKACKSSPALKPAMAPYSSRPEQTPQCASNAWGEEAAGTSPWCCWASDAAADTPSTLQKEADEDPEPQGLQGD